MAVQTTYTCDRCNHAQDTDDQMWSIAVAYAHGAHRLSYNISSNSIHKHALWCRKCMIELGILGPHDTKAVVVEPSAPAPTLEEVIREIIREEVAGMTGATA